VTKDKYFARSSPVIMAEDTREPDQTSSDTTTSPKKPKHEFPKTQVGKLWEAFGNPEEPVNVLPGSTYSPNREKAKDITFAESMKTLSMKDFATFYQKPCARDSLLVGLGAGFGIGGVRGLVGGKTIRK
jgi:cytochrome c oxidase assembly protein subunit 20